MRKLALLLLLALCLGVALAGRGHGRRPEKGGRSRGRLHRGRPMMMGGRPGLSGWSGRPGSPQTPRVRHEEHRIPFKPGRFLRPLSSSGKGCLALRPLMYIVNQTLHQQREKLHKMFGMLIHHAQSSPGFGQRRANLRQQLNNELERVVEHQCENAVKLISTIKMCNVSMTAESLTAGWHSQYTQVHLKLSRIAAAHNQTSNISQFCSRASVAPPPRDVRSRRKSNKVKHVCQRLGLLKCIFAKNNITLPTAEQLSTANATVFLQRDSDFEHGQFKPKWKKGRKGGKFGRGKFGRGKFGRGKLGRGKFPKFWKKGMKGWKKGKKNQQGKDYMVGATEITTAESKHGHGRYHKGLKLFLGVGALFLLVVSVLLFSCYVWRRGCFSRRPAAAAEMKPVEKEKETWTTPTDSTVAYLQAKGWRNPVYYVLEDEALEGTTKVVL